MSSPDNSRREFLQAGIAGTAALALSGNETRADDGPSPGLPQRPLGNTGVKVSIVCLGGWHIGDVKDKDEAVKIQHAAIDEGVNFFDNCWDYHDGGSEEIMGKALSADGGKWRKRVFLFDEIGVAAVKQYIDAHNVRRDLPAEPYPWICPCPYLV